MNLLKVVKKINSVLLKCLVVLMYFPCRSEQNCGCCHRLPNQIPRSIKRGNVPERRVRPRPSARLETIAQVKNGRAGEDRLKLKLQYVSSCASREATQILASSSKAKHLSLTSPQILSKHQLATKWLCLINYGFIAYLTFIARAKI